jgi:parallel beta-helix repeat protein
MASTGNTIQNNRVASAKYGILVRGESKNNLISNNTIESCRYGICLNDAGVTSNKIWRNTIRSCSSYGLNIRSVTGNMFFLNNISTTKTYVTSAKSLWNTTTPVTYLFNGVEHTGYLGNYWLPTPVRILMATGRG